MTWPGTRTCRRRGLPTRWAKATCCLVVFAGGCASGPPPRAAATTGWWGPARSNVDLLDPPWDYTRDCGYSAEVAAGTGDALWVFCDTARTRPTSQFFTSTAARGPTTVAQAPTKLVELGPAHEFGQFIPAPSDLSCPGGYTPPWTNGMTARSGTTQVLITYEVFCATASTLTPLRFGIATYDTATRTFTSNRPDLFTGSPLPKSQRLQDPVIFDDGTGDAVYFTIPECTAPALGACNSGTIKVARAPIGRGRGWEDRTQYQWWNGTTWSSDAAAAASVIATITPTATSTQRFAGVSGGPFVLLEQTAVDGAFRVWTAPAPTGPWTLRRKGLKVPDCGAGTGIDLCRAIIGHPELSTPTKIAYSAYRPSDHHVGVGWFNLDDKSEANGTTVPVRASR